MAFKLALTDTEIKRSKPAEKPYKLTDGGGLYIEVMPNGSKLWRYKYNFAGREKRLALGAYPVVTLAEAREGHLSAKRRLAEGVDPSEAKQAIAREEKAATEHTFKSVALLWWEHWRTDKSSRHADVLKRRMAADVFPVIGARPIAEIQSPELVALVKQIERRGAGDLAKRALQSIGQVFRYAVSHGFTVRNPATEFRPADVLKPTKKTNIPRIEARELPALLKAIEVYRGSQITRLALKLMAMTFVRTNELIGAYWDEFDLEGARWEIPAERMKMKTPHIVPLSRQAIEVLELLKTITGESDFLFPGEQNPKRQMSNNTLLFALGRMGYKGRMTGHGFRGLASTILHEQGWPHDHIELQLAHAPRNAVSAAYNHALYLTPRGRMMQHWSDFLEKTRRGKVTA
jgi:integrase